MEAEGALWRMATSSHELRFDPVAALMHTYMRTITVCVAAVLNLRDVYGK